MAKQIFSMDFYGKKIQVEVGEMAKQANGSCLVRYDDTVVLSTACAGKEPKDVDFFPLLLSYAVITMDEMKLYIDERKLNDDMKADLAKNNITIHPYNAIYEDIKNLDTASTVLVDPNRLNYALFNNIPGGTKVVQHVNPTI